jgi:hypothetical protein
LASFKSFRAVIHCASTLETLEKKSTYHKRHLPIKPTHLPPFDTAKYTTGAFLPSKCLNQDICRIITAGYWNSQTDDMNPDSVIRDMSFLQSNDGEPWWGWSPCIRESLNFFDSMV